MKNFFNTMKRTGFRNTIRGYFYELKKRLFVFKYKFFSSEKPIVSYSQYAEDLCIEHLLMHKKMGVYVDVGANHPINFSNTLKFYQKGWRGVNIEPDPENFALFLEHRPGDINLNIGVSNHSGSMIFYRFLPNTLSTFSEKVAASLVKQNCKLLEKISVPAFTLQEILDRHGLKEVDFLSIDTEGHDMQVLIGNNWEIFRPKVVCIEDGNGRKFNSFFSKINYKKFAFNGLNSFYIAKEQQ